MKKPNTGKTKTITFFVLRFKIPKLFLKRKFDKIFNTRAKKLTYSFFFGFSLYGQIVVLNNKKNWLQRPEVKTLEGYMSLHKCPTYFDQTSHKEGRNTCLFHQIDFPNQDVWFGKSLDEKDRYLHRKMFGRSRDIWWTFHGF